MNGNTGFEHRAVETATQDEVVVFHSLVDAAKRFAE
jgi:hypothetical protein